MSAKTHIPKKVTFTDSGTYLFWGNPLPGGPSSSLFQLPSTSCHSPARHFIQSHRMAAPLLLERVNSFPRHSPARHFIHSHRMAAPLHPLTQNGGPSASGARELVSPPLSRPPLHPLTQNGGPSASGARELVSSHTVPFLCLVLFSPRILREPLSLPQDFALLSLSQGSFPLNMVLNNEAPFPTTSTPHTPYPSISLPPSWLCFSSE